MPGSRRALGAGLARLVALAGLGLVSMMSDPKGPDLRAYLDQAQKTILKNWMPVWRRGWAAEGEVILRFSAHRSGKILKLAITLSSGSPGFDRSVTDVINASSPFVPAPEAFQGGQMALS